MALLCGKQFVRCVWGNSPCPSAESSVVCAWCCLFVLHNSLYVLHALGEFALDEERNSSISSNFQPLMNRLLGSQLCTGHLCPVMFQFHLDVSLQRPPPPDHDNLFLTWEYCHVVWHTDPVASTWCALVENARFTKSPQVCKGSVPEGHSLHLIVTASFSTNIWNPPPACGQPSPQMGGGTRGLHRVGRGNPALKDAPIPTTAPPGGLERLSHEVHYRRARQQIAF